MEKLALDPIGISGLMESETTRMNLTPAVGRTHSPANLLRKKQLGAFYTPDVLSAIVADWAITQPGMRVLEPGFGGCGFLQAAKMRLATLGQLDPESQIFGCDIDDDAFAFLRSTFNSASIGNRFPKIDFLDAIAGKTWAGTFDAALGNPPYVAYQALGTQRDKYQQTLRTSGWDGLSPRASLWAYFVLHALSFLRPGGRIAWVLPGSVLRSDYSTYLREQLRLNFTKTACFHVHERLFSHVGAAEETVVLLASGYQQGLSTGDTTLQVENLAELAATIQRWDQALAPSDASVPVTDKARALLSSLSAMPSHPLKTFLKAQIGIVTGDNPFFLFSRVRAKDVGIDIRSLFPVLAKGAMAPGMEFTRDDLAAAKDNGAACLLLSAKTLRASHTAINRYLKNYPKEKIEKTSTFQRRKHWFQSLDAKRPDAFWPVMRGVGPKLILNPQRLHCTNTVHRIFFAAGTTEVQARSLAICIQSSFAQVSAELVGRSYGSGVLKHEPREVERIVIPYISHPVPEHTAQIFYALDTAIRQDQLEQAMELADAYVAEYHPINYGIEIQAKLKTMLTALRHKRMPPGAKQHRMLTC